MISTRVHGVIDYVVAAALCGLSRSRAISRPVRSALGAAGLFHPSYSVLTDYEAGVLPVLTMRQHLALDALGAAGLCLGGVLLPRRRAPERALLLGVGLLEFAVIALSDVEPPGRAAPRTDLYPPLHVPKPVAADVWVVDGGPHAILGMALPVRMTVIRLHNGDLLLHSPIQYSPQLQRALEQLGRIRALVAPNIAHWMFLRDWQRACPDAETFAAPGLRQRRQVRKAGVVIHRELNQAAAAEWGEAITLVPVPGGAGFSEIALFHEPSRTLVLTDLVLNLRARHLPQRMRALSRLLGMTAPHGRAPPYLRAIVRLGGGAARRAASRLLALRPERVVFAHGAWFERDGTAALRRSLDWLVPGG